MRTKKFCNSALQYILLSLIVIFSCTPPVSLSGQTITATRSVPEFTHVSLAISADVYISQGTPQKVEIEADKNVMDHIETIVRGNDLVIRTENFFWRRTGQVKVYITTPEINGLQVSGSGDIVAQTPVLTDDINLEVSGSGSILIEELETMDISISITGSGNIRLEGNRAEGELQAVITGSGDFRADAFEVAGANVNITGSGTARINVTNELVTNITGSGDVYYKGNPTINANSTGSGRVRRVD